MKLLAMSACLALLVPGARQVPPVADDSRLLDATVTRDGQVVSVSLVAPRVLRFSAQRQAGPETLDLELGTLPEGAQLVAATLGAFMEHGLAAALAVETDGQTEYRWLYTLGDPTKGQLLVPGPAARPSPETRDGWTLSGPLFTSSGAPYRLVDIFNSGGDDLELTFRRGDLEGVRSSSGVLALDERVVHDVCALGVREGLHGSSVMAAVERVVAVR